MAPGDQRNQRRRLRVAVVDERGRRPPAGLREWLSAGAARSARGDVTVAIVSDTRMRALNRRFRRKDYPTDVLSFPDEPPPRAAGRHLGDIVIAADVARRQARDAGRRASDELRALALHGLLHLLGYDHETDDGLMARVERRLLRKGGLA